MAEAVQAATIPKITRRATQLNTRSWRAVRPERSQRERLGGTTCLISFHPALPGPRTQGVPERRQRPGKARQGRRLNDTGIGGRNLLPSASEEGDMLRKILAVDDSALIHQMYKLFLSRYKNCKLVSAMNGLEALDKLGQEEGIDLILLDINMPVMNGLEFLQRVQKEPAFQQIPVIIISTEGKEEDTIRGLKMGAKGYVKKPFQASELHGLIEKITADS
jgi:two-component system chemotaxis response regulator CheY